MTIRTQAMDSQRLHPHLSDDDLHALVDAHIPAHDRAALEARLALDPSAQATVAQWQQQRQMLRGLHDRVMEEPIPSSLLATAQQAASAHQAVQQWWRLGGIAAGVFLSFGTGWLANTAWQSQHAAGVIAKTTPAAEFVRQARFAHAVYSPEVRHPVEVTAAEQAHLVQWLSKRVGRHLKVPNLGAQGYELVGGRLLPGDAGARAQFMFQNATGTRITLYLGAMDAQAGGKPVQETAFRFSADGSVPSFYWVDQGFGYAVAGPLPREALMQLAEAVYHQL
jgi:anti-sigma factor RsiW